MTNREMLENSARALISEMNGNESLFGKHFAIHVMMSTMDNNGWNNFDKLSVIEAVIDNVNIQTHPSEYQMLTNQKNELVETLNNEVSKLNQVYERLYIDATKRFAKISGKIRNGSYSPAQICMAFEAINNEISNLESTKFNKKINGTLTIQVDYYGEPSYSVVASINSVGFSLENIKDIVTSIYDAIPPEAK